MAPDYPWPNQNLPQQDFSLPVSLGPMVVPAQKPARRWRGRAAGFLCVFAIGVAAGPPLVEYAYQGVDAGARILEKRAPKLLGSYRPTPPDFAPVRQNSVAAASPTQAAGAAGAPAPVPVAQPRPAPAARVAAIEPLPDQPAPPQAEPRGSHGKRSKTVAKPAASEPAPAPALAASSRKGGGRHDPFEGDDAPAAKREPKPAAEPAPAKADTRKPKSSDALDSLMADVPGDGAAKSKGKRSTSKDIDAMLKDVQKSDPAPAPKRVDKPADLPQLTSSDIAKAMAGAKTRANACGKRLGEKGVAEVKLTVGKDGKVSDSSVGGKIAGTPLAECVDKAVRATTFPPNAGLKFDYRIDVH